MNSFTGLVNVSWNAVAGETRAPLTWVAAMLPDVDEPESNEVWIAAAKPNPPLSVAAGETSTT